MKAVEGMEDSASPRDVGRHIPAFQSQEIRLVGSAQATLKSPLQVCSCNERRRLEAWGENSRTHTRASMLRVGCHLRRSLDQAFFCCKCSHARVCDKLGGGEDCL